MDVLDPTACAVLAEGRQLHVGVLTPTGPHVTPELYTHDRRHIWFLTAADTLKSRSLRTDPRVAAVVRAGSRALLLAGEVTAYDVGDPRGLVRRSRDAMTALAALTSFTARNASDLAAFARDLATGKLPPKIPPRRVLMRLRPARSLLLDGTALLSTAGDWPGRVTVPDEAPPLLGDLDCVVGVECAGAMAVLPGRATRELDEATVPAVAVQLAGLPVDTELGGSLVVDAYNAPGPAAKSGALLRGKLTFSLSGAVCRLAMRADRETTWDGVDTHTTAAS